MRIALLLLLSTFCIFSANAQVVNIPDVNFKNALLNHVPVINTNNDGEIQVSEALAFTGAMNVSNKNISNMTGVETFSNMVSLYCYSNQITSLSTVGLTSLQNLTCNSNKLTSLSAINLLSLKTLNCALNLLTSVTLTNLPALSEFRCPDNNLTTISLNNLPALTIFDCYGNQLTSMSLTNVNSLVSLTCSKNLLSSLPLTNVPQLKFLECSFNQFTSLPLTNLNALTWLDCGNNQLSSINLPNPGILNHLAIANNQFTTIPTGLNSLNFLDCSHNQISSLSSLNAYPFLSYVNFEFNLCTSFSVSYKTQLTDIRGSNNLLTSLTISNLPALKYFRCDYNQLTTLSVTNFPLLHDLICSDNLLTTLTVSNLPSLWELYCSRNKIGSLVIDNFPALDRFACDENQLTSLTLSNLPLLSSLGCSSNQLTSLALPALPKLNTIYCPHNKLSALSLNNFPALAYLTCYDNLLTSLSLTNLPVLGNLQCQQNSFASMNISNLPKLYAIWIGGNTLSSLTLSNLPMLEFVNCDSTKLKTLDLSLFPVRQLRCRGNDSLSYINIKNGAISGGSYSVSLPSGLQDICVDDAELVYIKNQANLQLPGRNVTVSSFCNFTPTGNYNTIIGTVRFDETANGCNNLDSAMNNVRINITDGTQSGSTFTNAAGQYKFYVQLTPDTVTTTLSNTLFTANPLSQILNFIGYGNTGVADFCVTANGIHPDLEIMLIPVTTARPGFDAQYKLVYRNKGNQVLSGTTTLNFDAVKLNFLSAVPNASSQTSGNLTWNYSALSPYQTRTITLLFHVNAPPIVNIGDILPFTAVINPVTGDETPLDNAFTLNQVVRGSYDPNDKDVTEGSTIHISKIGDYLHYIIRFQNTGNAAAASVIIKDSLANNLDWNSMLPVDASHAYRTVITKGNKVEFIFEGINLPGKNSNEPASHGFVSFKIKPKSSVTAGETINNKAEIYFDFNLPVITNTVSTTIVNPKKSDNLIDLTVYSNPVKDDIRFTVKAGSKIKAVNVYNTVGEKLYSETVNTPGTDRKVNIANLPTGMLFLQVITNGGTAVEKVIRIK